MKFLLQERMQRTHSINFRLASIFGLGEVPACRGTVATLIAGIPCFLVAGRFAWQVQLALSIVVFGIGWYVSEKAERELGRSDPGEIVIDELCGYLVAMVGHSVSFASILTGFLLFRLFDIWKPWPIRLVDRKLAGGIGIMADDVLAGIAANVLGLILLSLKQSGS
jgi:phosphatidylglycerophosphatase A